jgi:spermidine/putrescine transport system substrate-binding protein
MSRTERSKPRIRRWAADCRYLCVTMFLVLAPSLLVACSGLGSPPMPTPEPLADELILYNWSGDLIETLFDDFAEEYGIEVKYVIYETPEQAVENIRAGEQYDVVVLENEYVPSLVEEGLLAKIDYRNVPNFNHISANFRNLAYDPGNRHSIPYSWGTTGLVVRSDLVDEPVTGWSDMWDPHYAGRVIGWLIPRYTLGAALKSLGYSINSEVPEELEAALEHLIELKPNVTWLTDEETSAYYLADAEAVMALGWAYDVQVGQEENEAIVYVLPEDGTILWGDNFVIPANSPHKYEAELFLNFILRPEITGQLVNLNYYPMANDAAIPYIEPEILNDPVIYPPNEDLRNAEILLPLSPPGEQLYAEIWERFMAAAP